MISFVFFFTSFFSDILICVVLISAEMQWKWFAHATTFPSAKYCEQNIDYSLHSDFYDCKNIFILCAIFLDFHLCFMFINISFFFTSHCFGLEGFHFFFSLFILTFSTATLTVLHICRNIYCNGNCALHDFLFLLFYIYYLNLLWNEK